MIVSGLSLRGHVCAMLCDPRYRDAVVPHESTSESVKRVFTNEWRRDPALGRRGTSEVVSVVRAVPQVCADITHVAIECSLSLVGF